MDNVTIYTDGSCIKHGGSGTGNGGYAAILSCRGAQKEVSGSVKDTTNQRMEIMAVIAGLEALTRPCIVTLHTDSMYVVETMKSNWKRKANLDLWGRLDKVAMKHDITWNHVKGHNGNLMNERCNILAQTEARKE